MKQNVMKIGIVVGDDYGQSNFATQVTDPAKAIEEANAYIRAKYATDVELGIVTQHKRMQAR